MEFKLLIGVKEGDTRIITDNKITIDIAELKREKIDELTKGLWN